MERFRQAVRGSNERGIRSGEYTHNNKDFMEGIVRTENLKDREDSDNFIGSDEEELNGLKLEDRKRKRTGPSMILPLKENNKEFQT